MKNYLKILVLFAVSFSLYGCPEADGPKTETNTVDLAVTDTEAKANELDETEKK